MKATELLMFGYFAGAGVFGTALVIIILNAMGVTHLDPLIPLVGGFVLMFGSKFAYAGLRSHEGRR